MFQHINRNGIAARLVEARRGIGAGASRNLRRWGKGSMRYLQILASVVILLLYIVALLIYADNKIRSNNIINFGILLAIPAVVFFAISAVIKIRHWGNSLSFIAVLTIHCFMLIVVCATLYEQLGLVAEGVTVHDASSCLYFSIITWTTVGYGDIVPSHGARLVAASESFLGYIYMSILTGSVAALVLSKAKRPEEG